MVATPTLAGKMIAELVDNHEDYFLFNENLIALVSLADILKLNKKSGSNYKELYDNEECLNQLCIRKVKLHFTPWLEIIIMTCLNASSSEERILDCIYGSNSKKLLLFLTINEICLNIVENLVKTQDYELIPNHNITSVFYRFKEFHFILKLIMRCYDLAQSELARVFKHYKNISDIHRDSHTKFELIGGIIYFLYIICLETFTPGLNEFIRLSLSDLNEIIEYDPSLLSWTPEINLMHSILALHNRSDQNAIDDLLKLSIFESRDLKNVFKDILTSSLSLISFDELEISLKLIEKYGNSNIMSDFLNAYCIIKNSELTNVYKHKDCIKKISLDRISFEVEFEIRHDRTVAGQWMTDFLNHLE